MSDLVVIVYPTEERAEEVRSKLFQLQKEYLIKREAIRAASRLAQRYLQDPPAQGAAVKVKLRVQRWQWCNKAFSIVGGSCRKALNHSHSIIDPHLKALKKNK